MSRKMLFGVLLTLLGLALALAGCGGNVAIPSGDNPEDESGDTDTEPSDPEGDAVDPVDLTGDDDPAEQDVPEDLDLTDPAEEPGDTLDEPGDTPSDSVDTNDEPTDEPTELPADEDISPDTVEEPGETDAPDLAEQIDQPEQVDQPEQPPVLQGCIQGNFSPYMALIHAHTGYSDGELTPYEAFPYGRDQGQLDIFIITDHLDRFFIPWPVVDKLGECLKAADQFYEPGHFLTDCGYEDGFSVPLDPYSVGHNNVFYTTDLFSPIEADFRQFYQTLSQHPGAISQYNHPGDDDQNRNNWEYFPNVDPQINLLEFNGDTGTDKAWEYFFAALDAGWHLSPTYNQDNHGADWGTKNDRRTGFFLAELTREKLHDAMMEHRSFMSFDKNAWVKLVTDTGCWMGSVLTGVGERIGFTVEASDPDATDGFARIELYGPGREYVDGMDCQGQNPCVFDYEARLFGYRYYVAKVTQTDGEFLVSAPLWATP